MIDVLLWLIGSDWLEVKLVFGVAAIIAVLWFFRGSSLGIGIAASLAAWLGANLIARQGWEQKAKKDMRDADKLIERSQAARRKAEAAAPDHLRDDDGFRRD